MYKGDIMSQLINNREVRKETLKDIIKQLHEGKSVDEVKGQFDEVFKGVSAMEISEAEAALVMEGVQMEEIQKLCDVHAAVFKGSIEEIHQEETKLENIPGHPINTLVRENREIEKILKEIKENLEDISENDSLRNAIDKLLKIDIHYNKKENLMFPYMEKYDIIAPPKVMWGVDDEIRADIKEVKKVLSEPFEDSEKVIKMIEGVIERVNEMIFKEENIMLPMLTEKLTEDEWKTIADDSDEYGYIIDDVKTWIPKRKTSGIVIKKEEKIDNGQIGLPTGSFTASELCNMLNTLPFDITFVDKNDTVKYFSQGKERIFPRTKTILGRTVSNCHPPASVHVVEQIVEDFKSGKKDNEDFWIDMRGQFVYIRYFAVRDEKGEYLGTLEVTQDIKHIQEIRGEKRLVSD